MKKKLYKVTYACWESGCSGHEDYFLYAKDAKKYHESMKGIGAKLEKVVVDITFNLKVSEAKTGREVWNVKEGNEKLLEILVKDYKKRKKAK